MTQISIPYKLSILNSNQELINELLHFTNEQGFRRIAIITSKTPAHLLTDEIEIDFFDKLEKLKIFQAINPSVAYVNQLPITDFDVVIGVGAGKVIDTAKYAANINNIPCISIPTTISNDGICSPVSVLKEKQNKFKSLGAKMPIALFVPYHIVENSDIDSFVSGVGDLLSNLSAIEDWKLANTETGEFIDDYAVMISRQAALSILYQIENYILQRKTKEQFFKDNLKNLIESLALSGIAMEIAGTSRPASGAEHLISHAIDELFGGSKPHGMQVAFGMYITTFLRVELGYKDKTFFEELRAIFRFIGLPTTLNSFGLTKEQLVEALIHAPNTRTERYTILNKIKLEKNYLSEILAKLFDVKVSIPTV